MKAFIRKLTPNEKFLPRDYSSLTDKHIFNLKQKGLFLSPNNYDNMVEYYSACRILLREWYRVCDDLAAADTYIEVNYDQIGALSMIFDFQVEYGDPTIEMQPKAPSNEYILAMEWFDSLEDTFKGYVDIILQQKLSEMESTVGWGESVWSAPMNDNE